MASMTFFEGKSKLKDGTLIKFPRQNLTPGSAVIKADGKPLANGTYEYADGNPFTIANGVVGAINQPVPTPPAPVVVVTPVVVAEPAPAVITEIKKPEVVTPVVPEVVTPAASVAEVVEVVTPAAVV